MLDEDPPDPAGAATPAELTRRLRALWSWAGRPSEAALRSLTRMRRTASGFVVEGMPVGTVERVLSGDESVWESVEPFVASCLRVGSRSPERIGLDVAAWQEAWRTVAPVPVPRRPASGAIFGTRRVGPWARGWVAVRRLAGSLSSGAADGRRRGRVAPGTPSWRPAMIAAATVAAVFALGAWVVVGTAGHRTEPQRPPAVTRSVAPGQSAGTAPAGGGPSGTSPRAGQAPPSAGR
jgi:hypothetical protein